MIDIPEIQWAQVFDKHNGPLQYKSIPVPKPAPSQVLVHIRYTGVCHTDLHAWQGDWPLDVKLPLVGGHEGVGIVVALGDMVEDIKVGDHVGVKWLNSSCGLCDFCLNGDEPLCIKPSLSGYTVDGTFQQYCLADPRHIARFPKNVPLDAAAPILCGGLTAYKALKETGARPGNTIVITGAGGGLGTLGVQYGRSMGLRVIAIDSGDEKAEVCKKLGAEVFIDFVKEDVIATVKKNTEGLGAHAVVVLAVAEKPFQQATEYVRSRGTVVCVGMPPKARVSAEVFSTVVRMITIKGSYVGTRMDTKEAIDFFARGLIHAPFKIGKLSELSKVYGMMANNQIAGRYVLDTMV